MTLIASQIVDKNDSAFSKICKTVDEEADKVDIHNQEVGNGVAEDMPLDKWLAGHGLSEGTAYLYFRFVVRALLGLEPGEVSTRYFLDYIKSGGGTQSLSLDNENGAQYMRIRQGMTEQAA